MPAAQKGKENSVIKWEVYPSRRYIIVGFENGEPRFLAYEPIGHGRNRRVWHRALDEAILYTNEAACIKAFHELNSGKNCVVFGRADNPNIWKRVPYNPPLLKRMEVREIGFTVGRCCQIIEQSAGDE